MTNHIRNSGRSNEIRGCLWIMLPILVGLSPLGTGCSDSTPVSTWWKQDGNALNTNCSPKSGPTTGTLTWSVPFSHHLEFGPFLTADGAIIVANNVGIYAFSPHGRQRWVYPSENIYEVIAGPTKNVYVVAGNEIVALDGDGSLVWSVARPRPPGCGMYVWNALTMLDENHLVFYGGCVEGQSSVFIFDVNGQLVQQLDRPAYSLSRMAVHPAGLFFCKCSCFSLTGDYVYESSECSDTPSLDEAKNAYTTCEVSYGGGEYSLGVEAIGIDGSVLWQRTDFAELASGIPTRSGDGHLFLVARRPDDAEFRVFGLEPNGAIQWSFPLTMNQSGRTVLAVDRHNRSYTVREDRVTALDARGSFLWDHALSQDTSTPYFPYVQCCLAQDSLYVCTNDSLVAFQD